MNRGNSWPRTWWLWLIAVALAATVVSLLVANPPDPATPPFRCNGSTGVYTAPNGSQNVQPYDPACVVKPDQSPSDWGNGG